MGQVTQNDERPTRVRIEDVRRVRLRCAEAAADDRELREFLAMLGIGARLEVRVLSDGVRIT